MDAEKCLLEIELNGPKVFDDVHVSVTTTGTFVLLYFNAGWGLMITSKIKITSAIVGKVHNQCFNL